MTRVVEIDDKDILITPIFKVIPLENIPKSETAGYPVMENHEVVEVRFAGSKNYAPVFPAHEMWRREGGKLITYAEHWQDQYRAFKEGAPQEAMGTPLEMLRQHGVSPEQISLCRALRVYSIEALHALEGDGRKALGMNGNKLKEAAAAFMGQRQNGASQAGEIEDLKRQIAELQARSTVPPVVEPAPAEVERIVQAADDAYADLSDTQIKDEIAKLNDGKRPQGNPSRATLVGMLEGLMAA